MIPLSFTPAFTLSVTTSSWMTSALKLHLQHPALLWIVFQRFNWAALKLRAAPNTLARTTLLRGNYLTNVCDNTAFGSS